MSNYVNYDNITFLNKFVVFAPLSLMFVFIIKEFCKSKIEKLMKYDKYINVFILVLWYLLTGIPTFISNSYINDIRDTNNSIINSFSNNATKLSSFNTVEDYKTTINKINDNNQSIINIKKDISSISDKLSTDFTKPLRAKIDDQNTKINTILSQQSVLIDKLNKIGPELAQQELNNATNNATNNYLKEIKQLLATNKTFAKNFTTINNPITLGSLDIIFNISGLFGINLQSDGIDLYTLTKNSRYIGVDYNLISKTTDNNNFSINLPNGSIIDIVKYNDITRISNRDNNGIIYSLFKSFKGPVAVIGNKPDNNDNISTIIDSTGDVYSLNLDSITNKDTFLNISSTDNNVYTYSIDKSSKILNLGDNLNTNTYSLSINNSISSQVYNGTYKYNGNNNSNITVNCINKTAVLSTSQNNITSIVNITINNLQLITIKDINGNVLYQET